MYYFKVIHLILKALNFLLGWESGWRVKGAVNGLQKNIEMLLKTIRVSLT